MGKKAYGYRVVEMISIGAIVVALMVVVAVVYLDASHRASVSEVMALATQAGHQVAMYQAEHGDLPATLVDAGVMSSQDNTSLAYTVSSPSRWCVTVSDGGDIRYSVGSATAGEVVEGVCPAE